MTQLMGGTLYVSRPLAKRLRMRPDEPCSVRQHPGRGGAGGRRRVNALPDLLRRRPPAELRSGRWRIAEVDSVHDQPAAGWDREGLGSTVARRVGAGNVASQAMRWVGAGVKHKRARNDGAPGNPRRGVHVDAQIAGDDRDIGGELVVARGKD